MTPRRALAPALVLALMLSAAPALASTANNANNPNAQLTLTPTAAGEANTLTISYADASAGKVSGYTVHDATTPITLGGTCAGCTQSDANTVFVPAAQGVIVTTGDGDSSVAVSGQEPLNPGLGNSITGGAGKDTLSGGHLNDTINGGAGNDSFATADADGADAVNGGPGVDAMSYAAKTAAVSVTEDGAANDGVSGEGDNVGGLESVTGTAFNDVISMSGSTAGGTITGGIGDDTVTGSAARETVIGGAGADAIQAGGGGDTVTGDAGNDTIGAGAGDDAITPGTGNDSVDAGAGNDTFSGIANGDGADAYTGGAGDDSIDYGPESGPVSITEDGVANDGGAGENDNVAADIETLTGTTDADTIVGGPGANNINGNNGADHLDGGGGNDTVQSGCCDSVGATMLGGDGSDTLIGNTGDDTLDGGAGDDLLLGGNGGADTFIGGPGIDGVSFITSFFAGGVKISPDGVANDGRTDQGANVGIDVENLTGSFGPDTITGAPGIVNRIDGNGGGDTITVASSPADRDTVFCRSSLGIGFIRGFGVVSGSNDVVNADALDRVSDEGSTACATINRPAKVTPHAKILTTVAHTSGHVFTVSFQCLSAVPSCRISAQVATPHGTVLDTGHAVITSGKKGQILFHVSSQRRKALARGGSFKERVTAVVGDKSGRTSTVSKTITLKGA